MIHFVVALECEARALVSRFQLKRSRAPGPFAIYEGESRVLIVSGVGKSAAAAAVGYLQGSRATGRGEAWLNIGLAGHAESEIGRGVLAHKVIDLENARSWYPTAVFKPPCSTGTIATVGRPEKEFKEPWYYEMEASGFVSAAMRTATSELVHCYKVVSDNRSRPTEEISADGAQALIEGAIEEIDKIAHELDELACEVRELRAPHPELERFLGQWRFTVSERVKLERSLRRLEALAPGESVWNGELKRMARASDVLEQLERRLAAQPVRIGGGEAVRT